jgi:RimJ/RimL family protein N-acetyltransferase
MQFFIETDRLIMRDLLPTDDVGMFRLDSDADVHRYVGRKPVQTIEQSRQVIELIREQYVTNGIGRWAVVEKETGDFVGWSGLKLMTTPVNGHVNYYDLGYRFIKAHWGKGYATETALAAVGYGWDILRLDAMYACADLDNSASRRVLEKVGMQYGGTFLFEDRENAWYRMSKSEGR